MAKRIKKQDDIYTILNFDQVKADLKKQSAPVIEKIQKHVRSLEAFCADHRDVFGKAQSRKLLFGVLGWRKSTAISIKKTTLEKIKAVLSSAKRYLHIKETPNKEALAKLTDEQLASVDARRVTKEVFFAEPDMAKIETDGQ